MLHQKHESYTYTYCQRKIELVVSARLEKCHILKKCAFWEKGPQFFLYRDVLGEILHLSSGSSLN